MKLKLPIRVKLAALLCFIALTPILVVVWLDHRVVEDLGHRLANDQRSALIAYGESQLDTLIRDYAAIFSARKQILESLIRDQAREVETHLAQTPADRIPQVYFDHDFDEPDPNVPGVEYIDDYLRFDATGHKTRVPVSFERSVFRVAPGVDRLSTGDDIARLAGLDEFYKATRSRYGSGIYWQLTSLENGLHMSFPGHGGYPPDFDPRKRAWYRQQKQVQRMSFSDPLVDASTRQIVISVTMPVYRPDGRFAGVTAIDVAIGSMMERFPFPANWGDQGRLYLVIPEGDADAGRVRIIAKQRYSETGGSWQTLIGREILSSGDKTQQLAITRDMLDGRHGIRRMPYQGREALWAYRQLADGSMYLLFVVPYDAVTAAADIAHAYAIAATDAQIEATVPVVAVVLGGVILVAFLSARAVTTPVRTLADTANRIAAGDLEARVDLKTADEFERLAGAFNDMVPKLRERVHMLESLSLAREVQQNLLPERPPSIENLDVHGITIYCDETGGDYYDFIDLERFSDRLLGIAVGDVSGHGIPSALLMTTVRALLRSYAEQGFSPAEIMNRINDYLSRDVHGGRYMTLYYAVADTMTRSLRWANAGHAPALVYRCETDEFLELAGEDIPLGVDPDWRYQDSITRDWIAGDVAVLGTDGIWEARNRDDVLYGKERLKHVVRECRTLSAARICEAIMDSVSTFRGASPQSDDITVVVARITA